MRREFKSRVAAWICFLFHDMASMNQMSNGNWEVFWRE